MDTPEPETGTITGIDRATNFLTYLYGESVAPSWIFCQAQKVPKDKKELESITDDAEDKSSEELGLTEDQREANGKLKLSSGWFNSAEKFGDSSWYDTHSKWSIYFSIGSVVGTRVGTHGVLNEDGARANHACKNVKGIPALWTDVDACKQLPIPAPLFLREVLETEDISSVVQSSTAGMQFYWKLDKFFEYNQTKDQYDKHIFPLLTRIAYYYGGDFKAILPSQLLRLPGSYNHKPEYPEPYHVNDITYDKQFSLKDLQTKFGNVNLDTIPKIVLIGVIHYLQELWKPGDRHSVCLSLCGTMHKAFVDKNAMKALIVALCKYFNDKDVEDRLLCIETTYESDRESALQTLNEHGEFIHNNVKRILEYWMSHKVAFCKKLKIDYTPEKPFIPSDEAVYAETKTVSFKERGNNTYVIDEKGNESLFCNFILRIDKTIIEQETHNSIWFATLLTGGLPQPLKLRSSDHVTSDSFIKACQTSGIAILLYKYWGYYIAWKHETKPMK